MVLTDPDSTYEASVVVADTKCLTFHDYLHILVKKIIFLSCTISYIQYEVSAFRPLSK